MATTITNEAGKRPLKPEEACETINVTRDILRGLVAKGLPVIKLNSRVWRFDRDDIQAWMQKRRVGAL